MIATTVCLLCASIDWQDGQPTAQSQSFLPAGTTNALPAGDSLISVNMEGGAPQAITASTTEYIVGSNFPAGTPLDIEIVLSISAGTASAAGLPEAVDRIRSQSLEAVDTDNDGLFDTIVTVADDDDQTPHWVYAEVRPGAAIGMPAGAGTYFFGLYRVVPGQEALGGQWSWVYFADDASGMDLMDAGGAAGFSHNQIIHGEGTVLAGQMVSVMTATGWDMQVPGPLVALANAARNGTTLGAGGFGA